MEYEYTVVIEQDEDGVFIATVPALPGCNSFGDTEEEAREHLGVETQRQWSELAIERTTPVLLGLFSLVTLLAHRLTEGQELPVRTAAWYTKSEATFADALAVVRQHLWSTVKFPNSAVQNGVVPIPSAVVQGLVDTLCYAA